MSPIERYLRELVRVLGPNAARVALTTVLASRSTVELAGMRFDWAGVWARPKQTLPLGRWKTLGFLTGRGFGKTLGLSHCLNAEVQAGRAREIGLAAQDMTACAAVMVNGPSGLIATSPPWCKAVWRPSDDLVVWPNGAVAYLRSPENPNKVRGLNLDFAWLSELQSWPSVGGAETLDNFLEATRVGLERVVWDATGKSRNSLLKRMISQNEAAPDVHRLIRGSMSENTMLSRVFIEDFLRRHPPGTRRYREEFLGELVPDSENSLVKQAWIDAARRPGLARYEYKIIGIDPSVSEMGKGRDRTGIVMVGKGADGQIYVLLDATRKFVSIDEWIDLVLDAYVRGGFNQISIETNKGGAFVKHALTTGAKLRGLRVVTEKPTYRDPGTVFIKEVFARGEKADRAMPLSLAYERGQVSHVIGADLSKLEDTLCSYEPPSDRSGHRNAPSPDDLDALVHACADLLEVAERPWNSISGYGYGIDAPAPATRHNPMTAVHQAIGALSGKAIVAYDGSTTLKNATDVHVAPRNATPTLGPSAADDDDVFIPVKDESEFEV